MSSLDVEGDEDALPPLCKRSRVTLSSPSVVYDSDSEPASPTSSVENLSVVTESALSVDGRASPIPAPLPTVTTQSEPSKMDTSSAPSCSELPTPLNSTQAICSGSVASYSSDCMKNVNTGIAVEPASRKLVSLNSSCNSEKLPGVDESLKRVSVHQRLGLAPALDCYPVKRKYRPVSVV